MKQNTSFKIILVAASCAVLFTAFSSYAFYNANKNDPNLIEKVQKVLSERYALKNLTISINGQGGYGALRKTSDVWNFPAQTKEIEINAVSADIEMAYTDGDEIIVKANGELAENSKSVRLLKTEFSENQLLIEEADDGSSKNVKINVYIPKSFSKNVVVESVSGNVSITKLKFENLKANTVSGEINISEDSSLTLELNSVSGNIKLNVKNPNLLKVTTETVSGKILINHKTSNQGTIPVELHTVSGDITLD
ncbi:MAG: DUF4097 family beta strand repeat protein [Bdellovibrio sp.]|nr:DUF4097 family beta strand repeat protein [Bdellovibrio sp.]